ERERRSGPISRATGAGSWRRPFPTFLRYLDAFVPRDGECLLDSIPQEHRILMLEAMKRGDGWRVPPNPCPPDTSEEDLKWIIARLFAQSVKCAETRLRLTRGEPALPRSFVYCTRIMPGDPFRPFAERAKREPGWRYYELYASHSPHITAPNALA